VIDSPQCHRVENCLGLGLVRPGARRNHQRTLGVRVGLPRSLEEVPAGRIRERLSHEHKRDLLPGVGQLSQCPERTLGVAQALDAVVTGVALDELILDRFERVAVFVDDEENGQGHFAAFDPNVLPPPRGAEASALAGRGSPCDAPVVGQRPKRKVVERLPVRFTGADVRGPALRGPTAMAPVAIGALAIGAVAIGRLAIGRASIKRLTIEELEVTRLKVTELEVAGEQRPPV
jgi:hypothetical protein